MNRSELSVKMITVSSRGGANAAPPQIRAYLIIESWVLPLSFCRLWKGGGESSWYLHPQFPEINDHLGFDARVSAGRMRDSGSCSRVQIEG